MLENSSLSIPKVATPFPSSGGIAPRHGGADPDGRIKAIAPTEAPTYRPDQFAFRHRKQPVQDAAGEAQQRNPVPEPLRTGRHDDGLRVLAAVATLVAEPLSGLGDHAGHRDLLQHRDAAAIGSAAYRRAGGEPQIFSEAPELFRLAV